MKINKQIINLTIGDIQMICQSRMSKEKPCKDCPVKKFCKNYIDLAPDHWHDDVLALRIDTDV